jgi:hypothetical protein
MEPQLYGVAAERHIGVLEAQFLRVPEYVRHDMRTKVFGLIFAHLAALLVLTKVVVLFLSVPELAESVAVGPATTAPSGIFSMILEKVGWPVLYTTLVFAAGLIGFFVYMTHVCSLFEQGWKTAYSMLNALLVAALHKGHQDVQLRTLLPELLFILGSTLMLATGISLALSARSRARSRSSARASEVHGRWTGTGVVLAGVKVAGPAPSTLPSLPLLLAWLAAAWLGRAYVGIHSDVVITSFAAVCLFLIDADGPLQNGDPDDYLRIVVLFHSKVAILLLTAALQQLCVTTVGPSAFFRGLIYLWVITHVNPVVRFFARLGLEASRLEQLQRESERLANEVERLRQEKVRNEREIERLRRENERQRMVRAELEPLVLEAERLDPVSDRERLQAIVQRARQIQQEESAARHRAAAAAEEEEPPV